MATLEVVFSDKGLDKVVKACEKAAASFSTVGKRQQTTTDAFTKGPFARLQNYQAQMAKAQASGNVTAQRDLSYLIARTQKQIAGPHLKTPPSFGSRFGNALMSSRLNFSKGGIGISPLVGALAGAGPEGVAFAAVAGAAGAAASGLFQLAQHASEAAGAFAKLGFTSGSQGATAGALATLGGAGGTDLGGLAASFNSRITSDPTAMAFAARFGIHNLPGPYGNQDWGKELLQAIKGLRGIADFGERVRTARALGIEDALPLTNISDQQFGKLQEDAQKKGGIFSPEFQSNAADFSSSVSRIGDAVSDAAASIGQTPMKRLTGALDWVADAVRAGGELFHNAQIALGGEDGKTSALDNNTTAIDRNTQALQALPGYYGVGERGQRGLPPEIGGEYLRRGLEASGFRLGAF